ncbi:MAG: dynamin family protein, partial [Myxococcales bacterium]
MANVSPSDHNDTSVRKGALDAAVFEERSKSLDKILAFIKQALALENTYGLAESERHKRLRSFVSTLADREQRTLRIAVVGEYSRGKSKLLNALLGVNVLPTAKEQTTSINTFLVGVGPDGQEEIRIYPSPGTTPIWAPSDGPLRLPFGEDLLRRWGTESDQENTVARLQVERIEVATALPLFQYDVEIIDTPGFEGILPQHELIAKDAIDKAHVAIWTLAAQNLGGGAREWKFLSDTLTRNFSKFITVINFWDEILEPSDEHDRRTPLQQREQQKLDVVRTKFREQAHLDKSKVDLLVSDDNLIAVSALWGCSEDPDQRLRSNIDRLARRIEHMCLSGEGQQQIAFKPLQALESIVVEMEQDFASMRQDYDRKNPREAFRIEKDKLEVELQRFQHELQRQLRDTEKNHDHHQQRLLDDLKDRLVEPLAELEALVDQRVTKESFLRLPDRAGKVKLALPDEVTQALEDRSGLEKVLDDLRQDLDTTLLHLQEEFAQGLKSAQERLRSALGGLSLQLRPLTFEFHLDLTALEHYERRLLELETQHKELEMRIEALKGTDHEAELLQARQSLSRIQGRLDAHGPPPPPRRMQGTRKVVEKGAWSNTTYDVPEVKVDYTQVKSWEQAKADLEKLEADEEKRIQSLVAMGMARKAAQDKALRELEKTRREVTKLEDKAQKEREWR